MARLKMYRCVVAVTTVAVVGCALCSAQPQVRVAVSSDAITLLPVHLAQTLGFYRQEGLLVTLSEIGSSSKTLDALQDGSVHVALGTTAPIQMAAEGRSIQGFLVIYSRMNAVLMVSPAAAGEVHRIADLKGRRVGVSNLGSGSQIFLNYLLAANGMRPADVSAVGIGVGAKSLAAMEHGEVDAAVMVGGAINALLRAHPGPAILADTRTPEGSQRVFGPASFPGSLLVAEESWLKANPDTVRRFVRAVKKGMQWMGEHSPEEVRANMREDQRMPDTGADLETIRDFQHMLSPDGAIQAGSPEIMYKVLATSLENVRTSHIDLSKAYTNEYLIGK
jgi:NitT/TauT family transport system substrate-binding protein